MSVVNASQFALIRARKELEKAHKQDDWHEVRRWDQELGAFLDKAFDDENRDTKALINELEKILATYSEVVSNLSESQNSDWFIPDNR